MDIFPGLLGCLSGVSSVRMEGLVAFSYSHSLGFFGMVGLLVGKLRRIELMGLAEEYPGRGNIFELCPDFLVHFIEFVDLCLGVRAVF